MGFGILAKGIFPGSSSFCFSSLLCFCVSGHDSVLQFGCNIGSVRSKFEGVLDMEDGGSGSGSGGGGGGFSPNSTFGNNFSVAAMDLDFMDELLFEGCWLETSDGFNFMQPGPSTSGGLNDPSRCLPVSGSNTVPFSINSYQMHQGETDRKVAPFPYAKIEDLSKSQSQNWAAVNNASSLSQPGTFIVEGTEMGSRLWIGPTADSRSSSSVKERLMQAIGYLKESTKDRDVLIQIWVPVKIEGKNVLTTEGQPYSLNTNCRSLKIFRDVSKGYNFPAEEDSKESVGLPGRVYLGKLPEWTPDVRFFRSDEYPRINFAQKYNVGGSLALPVFERESGTCLGVVEVVTTTQKSNYRPELEHVCKALEVSFFFFSLSLSSSPSCSSLFII